MACASTPNSRGNWTRLELFLPPPTTGPPHSSQHCSQPANRGTPSNPRFPAISIFSSIGQQPKRNTTRQRSTLWLFEQVDTLRKTILQRAGRISRPAGTLTLTFLFGKEPKGTRPWLHAIARHCRLTRLFLQRWGKVSSNLLLVLNAV